MLGKDPHAMPSSQPLPTSSFGSVPRLSGSEVISLPDRSSSYKGFDRSSAA
jgi:hypothetical protein